MMSGPPEYFKRRVPLERIRYAKEVIISRTEIEQAYVPLVDVKDLALRFAVDIVGLRERTEVTYPADWIEAFKARWFPRWLLKRFPVRLARVSVEARALFPEVHPFEHRHLILYQIEHEKPEAS